MTDKKGWLSLPASSSWLSASAHHFLPDVTYLQNYFKLGIYSPAKDFTVRTVLPELEEAAGDSARIFRNPELILHRGHTQTAPQDHIVSGGKDWDTVKPLTRYFGRMHQVLLVDDDEYKVAPNQIRSYNLSRVPYSEDRT